VNAHASQLQRRFYSRDAESLAPALLGRLLVRILPDGTRLSGRIVETEAYVGVHDRASHAYNGRRTERNESMYAQPGTAYVYFTYGMHHCFNIVCGQLNEPVAVLVRALEPVEEIETMRTLRSAPTPQRRTALKITDLCSGPGKLCRALAVDRTLDRTDLTHSESLFLDARNTERIPESAMNISPRIGIQSSGEWASKPLRWSIRNNPHVSVLVRESRIRSTEPSVMNYGQPRH